LNKTEFLSSVALLAAVMAVLSFVEMALPFARRPQGAWRRRTFANLSLTLLLFGSNWVLITAAAAAAAWLSLDGRGILAGLPLAVQIAIGVVALDAMTYVAHWSMHKVPLLWRVHQVHHSDPFVDVTTSFRTHPIEGLWRFGWTMIPAMALGLPAQAIVAYRLLSALNALLEHTNAPVFGKLDDLLSSIWITPNVHKVHHAADPRLTDSNYGNLLSLFDRLFGTFTPTDRATNIAYGLGDAASARATTLPELLRAPFRAAGGPQGPARAGETSPGRAA
jgi:sterol desaturase/sphingolipid hydroxylase (fatty acid hydroxylase superfamily)